jgi:xanthine dehydrogenase YagS FAD-binding subunit
MRTFRHINAGSIEEACDLLNRYDGRAKINAGGSDLLLTLKDSILPEYPEAIINIKNIPEMDYISEDNNYIEIGSLATLDSICRSDLLTLKYPLLVQAAKTVAGPQIRNMATAGGNLLQDVRCWYYRYSSKIGGPVKCLRKGNGPCLAIKGDNRYHAIIGGNKCYAVCPSDMSTVLAALDATLTLVSLKGEREISVQQLYRPMHLNIEKNEILKKISFPVMDHLNKKQIFYKFTHRKPIDYAIVSLALITGIKEGVVEDVRIVLGAVACKPYRAWAAEEFIRGKVLDEKAAIEAAEKAVFESRPLSKNGYKVKIAKSLIKKALLYSLPNGNYPVPLNSLWIGN